MHCSAFTVALSRAPYSHKTLPPPPPHVCNIQADEIRHLYSVSLDDGRHFCGGTLIARNVVLTAAHCMGDKFQVRVGSHDIDEGALYDVKSTERHPKYNTGTDDFDLALVFLKDDVSDDIPTVRINMDSSFPAVGSMATTVGWGDMDPSSTKTVLPDELMAVDLEVMSNDECAELEQDNDSYEEYGYPILSSMVCTYTKGKDACQGDSGGP